jgi:hypothetical protein
VRFRKEEEMRKGEAALRSTAAVAADAERQDPDQLPQLPAWA